MRKSGILMHISSLPGPYGVGSMGKSAYDFVDFLEAAGQSYWQILPLSPTGYGNSPYQSFSTFAGNHYLIDLDILAGQGLLTEQELAGVSWGENEGQVDFGLLYKERTRLLKIAHGRFAETEEYRDFVRDNSIWLQDYALFMAIKEHFRGRDWQCWSVSLLMRLGSVMDAYREELRDSIRFQYFLQYEFFRQWKALRSYGAVPAGRQPPSHGGGRMPPGRLLRRRPALGQSHLQLGEDARRALPLVDPPDEGRRQNVRRGPVRPFPWL